jgi:hypothetical protein
VTFLNAYRGRSGVHAPGGKIVGSDRSEPQNRTLADVDARCDRSPGAYPRISVDRHTVGKQGERRIVIVVRRSAKVCALREDHVRADKHRRGVVDFDVVGSSNMVRASESPRRPNSRRWIKVAVRPD